MSVLEPSADVLTLASVVLTVFLRKSLYPVGIAATVLASPVSNLASLYGSAFRLQGLNFSTVAAVLVVASGLAWAGSWLAATRHIRAIEPA